LLIRCSQRFEGMEREKEEEKKEEGETVNLVDVQSAAVPRRRTRGKKNPSFNLYILLFFHRAEVSESKRRTGRRKRKKEREIPLFIFFYFILWTVTW